MGPRVGALVMLFALLVVPLVARADPPVVRAARGTPVVDGRLGESAWRRAPWTALFLQRSPETGAAAAHATRARVLYDNDALYVAVECATDDRPDARLGRRDAIPTGESLRVMVDARGDGASAFAFTTNPAGVQADAIFGGDGDADSAWDAVWTAEVDVHARGWRAEFRIPWRTLRFEGAAPDVHLQIERIDYIAGETTALVPVPADAPRYVSRFAQLEGIAGIHPGSLLEFRPYALGRYRVLSDPARLDPTPALSGALGGDIKVGINSDLVLDLTINPDFGQVEVDPAVVNLTTFEVFFPERRPFFLEGTDIFRTPIRLVHTRRVGASPGAADPLHAGGAIDAIDPVSNIWGAVKLTGRVGPYTVGILDAVTGPAMARERWADGAGLTRHADQVIRPATNWLAARVRTNIARGSTVGAIVTHVGRVDQPHDVVGGIDWDWRAPDGVHRVIGQFAASHAWNAAAGQHDGQALYLEVSRAEDTAWLWTLRSRVYSREFDPNGLGYLERPNLVSFSLDTTLRTSRPSGLLRSAYINPWAYRVTNMDGLVIDQGVGLEAGLSGQSQWSLGLGGKFYTERYDDRETRGGIPYRIDPSFETWAWIDTDQRGPLRGGISAGLYTQNGGHRANVSLSLTYAPTPWLTLAVSSALRVVVNMPRWIDNPVDGLGITHAVFGQQRARIVDTTLRAGFAFSRRATLDLFSQLLVGSVRYQDFTELVAPDRAIPYAYATGADYDVVSLTVNAVARYEYQPGAFFTLVMLHRAATSAAPGDMGFGQGPGLLGSATPDNLLLAKLTYLLM